MTAKEGDLLWEPGEETRARQPHRRAYLTPGLERERGLTFPGYAELWRWSVAELESFWRSIWDYFEVRGAPSRGPVLASRSMPGARWFEGARLNYAEQALRRTGSDVAVVWRREGGGAGSFTRDDLRTEVARARRGLRRLGVTRGDCVAAFLPNGPEALVAFLATASLGGTWSSCSPEFGVESVVDRFAQTRPKVLLGVDGYRHGGKSFDRQAALRRIAQALPSLEASILVDRTGAKAPEGFMAWSDLLSEEEALAFEPVAFDHPLWVLYSSGTTGLPKAIDLQGHGGILLEHLESLSGPPTAMSGEGDRFFWFSTTSWMMWNFLVSGLTVGATIVLYEGSPAHPEIGALFRLAAEERVTYFGTSAPYLLSCKKAGIVPARLFDLSRVRAIGSTGAPLPVDGFEWVYESVKRDVHLASVAGGTDVCTAFVTSCSLLPVHAGEIQCNALGAKVEAFDPTGRSLVDAVGELVITEPMPSMPVRFLDDPDGARLRESYFADFPGVWRHGDWIKITSRGTSVIYGRSDSTLNRGGVRMGTAEFYRVVEELPEIADSLVVDTSGLEDDGKLWLFVVLTADVALAPDLEKKLRSVLRDRVSPRHVPDEIVQIQEVPRTLNGKKVEVPIKRLLMGASPERVLSPGTLANPHAIVEIEQAARARDAKGSRPA